MANVRRQTVDLTEYPELVVVYLGMEAKTLSGVRTLVSFGPKIKRAVEARPDGLLFHQLFLFSFLPLHAGIRQYWRDFDALERWVRAAPHRDWWRNLLRGGSGPPFGMRPISRGAAWSRSSWTWTAPPGCWRSHQPRRHGVRCSQRGVACEWPATSWSYLPSPKRSSTDVD